ncbi:hypothetical protein CROQUDRAFT_98037 [Cronartium quercuum f. sp. fusiforme G11]|uniref:Cytochrome P450 n=1 Tax=Cronartium quercuum f. sp. fusiforme G11 TaxID=708437 RepID=A0A9P6N8T2_9BASI|nr:hypothetical protein CROQUDRAFT_98037 [Cronartium quercuum f. sp. fusiforme G11]
MYLRLSLMILLEQTSLNLPHLHSMAWSTKLESSLAPAYGALSILELKDIVVICSVLGLISHFHYHHHEPSFRQFNLITSALGVVLGLTGTKAVVAGLSTYLVTLGTSIAIYRTWFSPLKHFPGSPWASITMLWLVYHRARGRSHRIVEKLHAKYGPIVRIGPNDLSVTDPRVMRTIGGVGQDAEGGRPWLKGKGYAAEFARDGEVESLQATRDFEDHQRMRKKWKKAFTSTAVAVYIENIQQRIDEMVEDIDKKGQAPVEIRMACRDLAFNVMWDLAFGGKPVQLADPDYARNFDHALAAVMSTTGILHCVPWLTSLYGPIHFLLHICEPAEIRNLRWFKHAAKQIGLSRLAHGPNWGKDVFHHLLGEDEEGKRSMTDSEITAAALLLIPAGSDTTSVTLTGILHELAAAPELCLRLRTAIETEAGPGPFTSANLAKVPLLEACIQEGLRLFHPGPSGFQRLSPANRSVYLQGIEDHQPGWLIPPETHVTPHSWTINRSECFYGSEPERFRPERWWAEVNPLAVGSFGHGTYNCMGKNIAMSVLRNAIGTLVTRYDLTLCDPVYDNNQFMSKLIERWLLRMDTEINVRFQPRSKRV